MNPLKVFLIIAILVVGFVMSYANPLVEVQREEIKTEAKGKILKYRETSFYSKQDFAVILGNQEKFKSQLIERFKKKKIIGVIAENCEVDFNEPKKSVTLRCDIRGARYSTNSYSMHFLLGNWPFDLYQFKEYEKKLVYKGKINGIPTTVIFEFPYSFSHCHEHVWPK